MLKYLKGNTRTAHSSDGGGGGEMRKGGDSITIKINSKCQYTFWCGKCHS